MITSLIKIYEDVYGSFSGNKNYELVLTPQNSKYLQSFNNSFIDLYNGSIDEEFIFEFIVYQFRYYEDKKTRLGKGKVYLNWILGSKAIDRWREKPDSWLYFNSQFVEKYNLQRPTKEIEEDKDKVDFYNKTERKRFFNTELGFLHCSENNLYEKYSKECIICRFKEMCNL